MVPRVWLTHTVICVKETAVMQWAFNLFHCEELYLSHFLENGKPLLTTKGKMFSINRMHVLNFWVTYPNLQYVHYWWLTLHYLLICFNFSFTLGTWFSTDSLMFAREIPSNKRRKEERAYRLSLERFSSYSVFIFQFKSQLLLFSFQQRIPRHLTGHECSLWKLWL